LYCIRTSAVAGTVLPNVREVACTESELVLCWHSGAKFKGSSLYCIRASGVAGTVVPTAREVTGVA